MNWKGESLEGIDQGRLRAFRARVQLVIGLFVLVGLLVAVRAWQLQVARHEQLSVLARRQGERVLRIQGRRGDILDRNGLPLALSIKTDSLYAHPWLVKDAQQLTQKLALVLEQQPQVLLKRLQSDAPFVWLARQLSPAQASRIQAATLKGVGFTEEYKRVYPARELASTVMGFVGVDNQGLAGLEYAYDFHLRGAEHMRIFTRDALGRSLPRQQSHHPSAGGSLRLTLDSSIQFITERVLAQTVKDSQAQQGMAVVLHSPTGAILALAQYPSFNPNTYRVHSNQRFINHAINSGYEPGSVMKAFTLAGALEEQLLSPQEELYCEAGDWQHHDSVIHDSRPYQYLTPRDIIKFSSNICAAKIGLRMSPRVFRSYLRRLGFGSRLGLFRHTNGKRLASEATGRIPVAHNWTTVDHAAISFGHGLLISPLQLVAAVNVLANDGVYLQPYLVEGLLNERGQTLYQNRPQPKRRVFSSRTTAQVRSWMEAVIEPGGTGTRAALPGIRVAGKTGTTEIYDIQAQGYSKTLHLASFAGFVPANQPLLTIVVIIEQPLKGRYGGVVATPVFRRIAAEALPILGAFIPSSIPIAQPEVPSPSFLLNHKSG